ncbi:MAG: TetR/AcrR family transcriptional regulator [Desulfovibrio sp.]|nr:TetR/AcrR family transcriptional regulator [Desulfovibrio sp.]
MDNTFTQALGASDHHRGRRLTADYRRQKILEAAKTLFFKNGYAATSIDDIIHISGGSRRCIYDMFGNKRGLFNALVRDASQEVFKLLDSLDATPMTAESLLCQSGERILMEMFSVEWNFMRVVIMESLANPDLTKLYHENGPILVEQKLGALLEKSSDRESIGLRDCREASALFVGMMRNAVYSHYLAFNDQPSSEEIRTLTHRLAHVVLYGLTQKNKAFPYNQQAHS